MRTLVIPLTPGGAVDVTGRAMAEELAKLLKVPVVPLNRPGAGRAIGTDSVVKAKKDGYTILFTPNAALVSARIMNPGTGTYDPVRDLTPLGATTRTPILLAVRADAPYRSFPEMVEFSGLTMVPFKGGAPGITALLGGHVEGGAFSLGALSGHLKSGALRGMVASNTFPGFSDIPTLLQLGHRQDLLGIWLAFFAPAGVPAEVTRSLVPAIEKVARDPALAAKLVSLGILQDYAPPEKLVADLREEHRSVEALARKAGLVQ